MVGRVTLTEIETSTHATTCCQATLNPNQKDDFMRNTSTLFALSTALLLTLTSASAFAEDAALGGIGLKAGGALTRVAYSGSGADDFNDNINDDIGYSIGIQAVFGINDFIAIQPELLYINKGYELPQSIAGQPQVVTDNFDYVQLPVLASLRLPLLRVFTPKLLVGPHLAYKIGGNKVTDRGNDNESENHRAENFNPIDFGFTLGAGFDVGLESFTLNVELRYELGLVPVDSRDTDLNYTHNQVGFMLGILI